MQPVSNPFQACNDIFYRPSAVFKTLLEKQNWAWIPFILVVVIASLPGYLYFDFVDFTWYSNLVIDAQYGDLSPSEQQIYRDNMSAGQMQTFALIGTLVGYVIINAVLAAYLNLMTRSDEENLNGFTDWYGFTWWASLPSIIPSVIALFIILIASDHQLNPSALSPTSIGYWLGIPLESDWNAFTQSIRLDSFWAIFLIGTGINQWTSFSKQKSIIIAAAPYAVIWAIWAVIVVL